MLGVLRLFSYVVAREASRISSQGREGKGALVQSMNSKGMVRDRKRSVQCLLPGQIAKYVEK